MSKIGLVRYLPFDYLNPFLTQKQGLADLQDGLIRTPLAPDRTFTDDPLRMFRAIRYVEPYSIPNPLIKKNRFSARFGFDMEEQVARSIQTEAIRSRLATIKRERIGSELHGILSGTLFTCRSNTPYPI